MHGCVERTPFLSAPDWRDFLGRKRMLKISFSTIRTRLLLAGGFAVTLGCAGTLLTAASAQNASPPDFMQGGIGWNAAGAMEAMPGPAPVSQDPKIKYTPNNVGGQPTWRYADVNNPNLTEFAKEGLLKANMMVDGGFALYN